MTDELLIAMADEEDPVLLDTPSMLPINVGDGDASELIIFTVAGSEVDEVTLDEYGTTRFDVMIPELAAGSYTLTATGTVSGSTSLPFTVVAGPLDHVDDGDAADALVPPTIDTAVTRWRLVDTTAGGEDYTFPHNPKSWTNPLRPNFLEHEVTTAPDGQVLAWQGGDRAWTFSFTGFLDTQAEYEALEYWTSLRRRFWLVDHRHRVHYVTFEKFDATARILPGKPWAHDYTIEAVHFYRQDWDGEA